MTLEEFVKRGRRAQKSVDEILGTCVKCGHAKKDHKKGRGGCKFYDSCLCYRFTGR